MSASTRQTQSFEGGKEALSSRKARNTGKTEVTLSKIQLDYNFI